MKLNDFVKEYKDKPQLETKQIPKLIRLVEALDKRFIDKEEVIGFLGNWSLNYLNNKKFDIRMAIKNEIKRLEK